MAARLGLPPRSNVTTKVLQKAIWAGANSSSYLRASEALEELAGIRLSVKQIRRLIEEVGRTRLAERDAAVEHLQTMPLPQRRVGSRAVEPPALAVISMDGGRYQRRDNFRGEPAREEGGEHWRETKVGCLLSMESEVHDHDPQPQLPEYLITSEAISQLAKIAENSASAKPSSEQDTASGEDQLLYQPPQLIAREVLASGDDAEQFGWQLEARAWHLGFPAAERQAFVADGAKTNWRLQRKHFPKATPIVDLMHALSYAWSAAVAMDASRSYRAWATCIWRGEVAKVIAVLAEHQQRLGLPPPAAGPEDPRKRVDRALTYYRNNQSRMNYPEYRRLGLPLTSSHIESTIKQINQRVKGSEKFWCRSSGDAVLQLRADHLSDTQPLTAFWQRWQADQTGSNRYHTAA